MSAIPLQETADRLANEVAHLSAKLSERAAWSAKLTAEHTNISNQAASEALVAAEQAESETAAFLSAARTLREECSSLLDLREAVKVLLKSVASLEEEATKLC